jgi:hypothetical protein
MMKLSIQLHQGFNIRGLNLWLLPHVNGRQLPLSAAKQLPRCG